MLKISQWHIGCGKMMTRGRVRVVVMLPTILFLATAPWVHAAAAYDWPQFGFDMQHSGANSQEAAITAANVHSLSQLFRIQLPSTADGAPAYLGGTTTPGGVQDLLFVTTKDGSIIALDAHTGVQVWSQQYGPTSPGASPPGSDSCSINTTGGPCYTTSSPAVDPNRQYVYSYGLDGRVHKYQVGDGTEIQGGGWPEVATIKPWQEKGSSALSIATAGNGTSYLYVTNGGYPGDRGDYQGHVTAINLDTGSQHVFNTMCSDQVDTHFTDGGTPGCGDVQSAIWARAGVVYDSTTDRIYMSTGNGTFDPANHHWGDTVFVLNVDGSSNASNPLDSYTPTNYADLQTSDADVGSTAPAILPAPPTSQYQHLAVQGGKDATVRLLNLDDLSGQGGAGNTGGDLQIINVPQGDEVLTQPAVWVNGGMTWVFVATRSGIAGLQLQVDGRGNPSLVPQWTMPTGGTSPIVANGVLYYASSGLIQGLNPLDGSQLWQDATIGGIHWESPIVANGIVYITDESRQITAYNLPELATMTASPNPVPAGAQGVPRTEI